MNHFTAEEWAALITAACGALGGLIVAIINALKGHTDRQEIKARLGVVEAQQRAHEENAERRARSR